jgi:hypothetical protein
VFAVVCILYTFFGGSPAREADKTGIFLKKILRFVGSPTNIGARGVDVAGRLCHVAVMFIGEPTNISPTWHKGGRETTWRTFIGQVEPTNVRVLGSSAPHGR